MYGKINRSNLNDVYNLKENGFKIEPVTGYPQNEAVYYNIVDDSGAFINYYDEIRHPVYNMDLGSYVGWLPFFNKTFGFDGSLNFNFPIKGVEVTYKPAYSILVGLFLRMPGTTGFSTATFTINGGFENSFYSENAWDKFALKASIGVPFALFEKTTAAK